MPAFNPIPNRDAYAAILGFRYQADWTIIRWCELKEGETLELECGEDIDLVASALGSASQGDDRQLQQIKLIQKPITLRNPQCLESLSNFAQHRNANPSLDLRFCFCTNSRLTAERPSPFRGRIPGITVWGNLQEATYLEGDLAEQLDQVRKLLQNAKKPTDHSVDSWKAFQDFLETANNTELHNYVQRFEWHVGEASPTTLVETVRLQLKASEFVATDEDAGMLHAVLFYKVIELLSQPGTKRLDRASLKGVARSYRTADIRALTFITTVVFGIEQRLAELEKLTLSNQLTIATVNHRISEVVKQAGFDAIVDAVGDELALSAPPHVKHLAKRAPLVASIVGKFDVGSTLTLRGTFGVGKSQLALLINDALGVQSTWLSLRDCDETDVVRRIWLLLRKFAETTSETAFAQLIPLAMASLKGPDLLVLEDVPKVSDDSPLSKLFIELFKAASENGIRLLITTHYQLPETLSVDSQYSIEEVRVPGFDTDETLEVLRAFEAPPDRATPEFSAVINGAALSHPMYVIAAIRRLQTVNWEIGRLGFDGLMGLRGATAISSQTLQKVLDTVESSESRDLLYRLAIIFGNFDAATLLAVAAAKPELPRPMETALRLDGLWLERFADASYSVSPLIRPIAETELSEDTKKNVFVILGDQIVRRKRVSIFDVTHATLYFSRGGNLNKAALFLMLVLDGAKKLPKRDLRYLLDLAWGTRRIPETVSLTIRLFLRARQIRLFRRVGKIPTAILDEGDDLVAQAQDADVLGAFSYLLMSVFEVARLDFTRSCAYMKRILAIYDKHREVLPTIPLEVGQLVWTNVIGLNTTQNLKAWLDFIVALTPSQRNDAFNWHDAERGCLFVLNSAWLDGDENKFDTARWRELEQVYSYAADIGENQSVELLWACAVRAKIIVLAEYLKDFDAAVGVANAALAKPGLTKSSLYLLNEIIGRQYVYQKKSHEAKHHLIAALYDGGEFRPELRCWSHLELASAYGDADATQAATEAARGVEIARSHPLEVDDPHLIRCLGELSIACWRGGNRLGAFNALDEAARRILDGSLSEDESDSLLPRVGNCAGYYSSMAATGSPPNSASDGREYVEPPRRLFLGVGKAVAEWFRTTRQRDHYPSLCASLSVFADAVGRDDVVSDWALRGIDEARSAGNMILISVLGQQVIPALLKTGDYPVVLDVIRECGANARATKVLMDRGADPNQLSQSADQILLGENDAVRQGADKWSVNVGMISLLLHLGLMSIGDRARASEHAAQVIESIESVIGSTYYPEAWQSLVRMLRQSLLETGNWQAIREEASQWGRNDCSEIQTFGYLAATLDPEAPLDVVAIGHVLVLWYVEHYIAPLAKNLKRQIAEPLVFNFWTQAFKQRRFLFTAPAIFERDFANAMASPEEDRLVKVLQSVIGGSGARQQSLPQYAKDWLYAQ